jgi:hypothetical protein
VSPRAGRRYLVVSGLVTLCALLLCSDQAEHQSMSRDMSFLGSRLQLSCPSAELPVVGGCSPVAMSWPMS